ncbi:alkaline phosphatase D family protein [Candidatus Solirubrobacter pratensis]|uniref:alkaline phosphatase D family protein n=1 Tax=Candidatus Solirubrobacter pratensis TaxID=1298857 RepID=UPI00041F45D2|nr:alkaline phosphatase D family protein [Candidatus Solirubrobacter pratensis]
MGVTGNWDRRISRRTLLRTGGSLAAGAAFSGPLVSRALAAPPFAGDPFSLGIASGDPLPDGIVLWTRLAPDPTRGDGGMKSEAYGVRFELARDEGFNRIVRRGAVEAVPEEAHSVHVELDRLEPSTEYFYRFKWGTAISPVGRTRSAPPEGAGVDALRFAFVSCQNYPAGYFTPYADIATQDLDLVVHLGDYIYEGPASDLRAHAPLREIFSLDDYRVRHAQYKTDLDLQAAHAALPWMLTWDDHEVANNYASFESDPDSPLPDFTARRAAAYQAYWEHMPLSRAHKPKGPYVDLYRRMAWGSLATFNMLDGRQYRSDQPAASSPKDASGYTVSALDPSRTMLGATQLAWLEQQLRTTSAGWNVLANQVAFAPYDRDPSLAKRDFGAGDNWDGYVADRQRILDTIVDARTRNAIVITGDSHANWVRDIPPNSTDFDAAPVGTEFMGTSISTGGDPAKPATTYNDDPNNPQLLFHNNNRGYVRCTVTPQQWTSDYRIVPSVRRRGVAASTLASFVVQDGVAGAQRA